MWEKMTIRGITQCATLQIPGAERGTLKTTHGTVIPEKMIPRLVTKFPAI
jgi:hypothetical protein